MGKRSSSQKNLDMLVKSIMAKLGELSTSVVTIVCLCNVCVLFRLFLTSCREEENTWRYKFG